MKPLIIILLIAIIEALAIVGLFAALVKFIASTNKYKNLYENYKVSASKVEENISNANKKKNKLNTGDDVSDLNNGLNILQEYANKK